MMPVFTVEVFHTGATGLGILMSVTGVGALVGSLLIAYLGDYKRKGLLLTGTALLFGVSIVLFALAGSFYLSLFFLLFAGAGGTGYMAINNTLVQTNATHEVRGRVMSVYMMTWGLMPLGTLPTSWTAEALGAPLAVAAGGGLLAFLSLGLALLRPNLWHLE
jgi:MFS family permease